jgi:protein-S-isoprenylcysteine O-methyltransferase Ste14
VSRHWFSRYFPLYQVPNVDLPPENDQTAILYKPADFNLTRFEQSLAYDALTRLPIVAWSAVLATSSMVSLEGYVHQVNPTPPGAVVFSVTVAMRLSVVAYLIIIAGTVLTRMPASRKARGAEPRISAVIGTFLLTAFVLFPRRGLSVTESVISTLLILAGNVLAASVIVHLRGSFSIMPETRQLVTSGPYRFIRHPLYLAEGVAAIGGLMQFLSVWTIGLVVVQLAFQLRRMQNEEILLTDTFPEYLTYKSNTSCLIPGIY